MMRTMRKTAKTGSRRLPPRISSHTWRLVVASLAVVAGLASEAPAVASPASVVALSESSNGHTVSVRTGTHLTLTLHSTYWTLTPLLGRSPVTLLGKVSTVGTLPSAGSGCVPGQGCGTVIAHYVARHVGQLRLRATRTSCGEALKCSAAQSVWTVLIRVR